jgi:transcriptional regulator with XRE-family HTH domain
LPSGEELPSALKRARKAANLTQQEAAVLVGVTVATISRWERGERSPSHRDVAYVLERYTDHRTRPMAVPHGTDEAGAGSSRDALQAAYDLGWREALAEVAALLGSIERRRPAEPQWEREIIVPPRTPHAPPAPKRKAR